MLEVVGLDRSGYVEVVVGEGSVDGADIGGVFVSGELESLFEDEFVDLRVEFHPEEGHLISFINLSRIVPLIHIQQNINCRTVPVGTSPQSSSACSDECCCPKTPSSADIPATLPLIAFATYSSMTLVFWVAVLEQLKKHRFVADAASL